MIINLGKFLQKFNIIIQTLNDRLSHVPEAPLSRNAPKRMRDFSLVGQTNLRNSNSKKSQVRHLLSIWIQSVNSCFFLARNTLSREAIEDQDDPLEYAGGEFDEDEPVESVRAARDVKKLAVSVRGKVSSIIHSLHCLRFKFKLSHCLLQ